MLLVSGWLGWRWWQASQIADPQAAQTQSVPVRLDTVETVTVETASEFVGNLESRDSVTLRPAVQGRVTQVYVESGDRVPAGTPLVQLSADEQQANLVGVLATVNSARAIRSNQRSELQALEAERISAVAEVELQNEQFRRTQALATEGALPRQNLDEAERNQQTAIATLRALDQRIQGARASLNEAEAGLQEAEAQVAASRAQLQDTTITAPFAGVVGDIPVKVGDYLTPSDPATSVTRNQELELRLSVPLERRSELRVGLPVELSDAQGNPITRGQINFVSPQVESNAQSILTKATFPNPDGQLLDQQFVRARVIWNQRPGVLVPTAAISRLGTQTFVFVVETAALAEGQPAGQAQLIARQRPVELGSIQNNQYQVLEGLQPGEQIVVSGVPNLQDGAPISAAPPASPPLSSVPLK
ncbi:MAG: efflux RND transporter periplasmic adaptor subunit [Oculatellaceae cyanobacterium Prado106]|nr:efflux RND transporter periplasmic adaptor subunit [Oculatellaceae cyanobacterium Prado106]